MSPDPYRSSAELRSPGSWNRYAYVEADPVNLYDPLGLDSNQPCGGGECLIQDVSDLNDPFGDPITESYDQYVNMVDRAVLQNYLNSLTMEQFAEWFDSHIQPLGPDAWGQHATTCTASNLGYLEQFGVQQVDAQYNSDGGIRWRLSTSDADPLATSLVNQGFKDSSISGMMHNGDVGSPNTDYRSLTNNTTDRSVQVVIGPVQVDPNTGEKYQFVYADTDAFNPHQGIGGFLGHTFFEVLPGLVGFNTSCR